MVAGSNFLKLFCSYLYDSLRSWERFAMEPVLPCREKVNLWLKRHYQIFFFWLLCLCQHWAIIIWEMAFRKWTKLWVKKVIRRFKDSDTSYGEEKNRPENGYLKKQTKKREIGGGWRGWDVREKKELSVPLLRWCWRQSCIGLLLSCTS